MGVGFGSEVEIGFLSVLAKIGAKGVYVSEVVRAFRSSWATALVLEVRVERVEHFADLGKQTFDD